MADELKPCPFCGGEGHIDGTSWTTRDGKDQAWVTCKFCGTYGPSSTEAITAWNRRTPDLIPRADAELAVAEAIRRAADLIVSSAYTSNGDRRSLEPVAESLRGADQHHATIAAAIRALASADALAEVQRLRDELAERHALHLEQVRITSEWIAERDAALAQLNRHLSIFADHAAVVWGIIRAAGDLPGLADGPYKDGFIAGMEEVAARGDIQAADGHHQLQNLCEQIVALVTGQATLVMAPADEVASKMAAAAERDTALAEVQRLKEELAERHALHLEQVRITSEWIAERDAALARVEKLREAETSAESFDRADWFWRTMDPDDCGDSPEEAISRAMVGQFCVCEIACSFAGPTRYGFIAPVSDPESDDEEFIHFATQDEAINEAKRRAAMDEDARHG